MFFCSSFLLLVWQRLCGLASSEHSATTHLLADDTEGEASGEGAWQMVSLCRGIHLPFLDSGVQPIGRHQALAICQALERKNLDVNLSFKT